MAPYGLILAYALGLLIALPQLIPALRYFPKSIRNGSSTQDKASIGSVPVLRLLKGLVTTRTHDQVDGVFYPEACGYVGVIGLLAALFSPSWHQWVLVIVAGVLTLGRRTPVFRWCAPLMLRIPARMVYFVGFGLVFMAVSGLATLHLTQQALLVICLLQAWDLCMNTSRLWPMEPFVQRWERPSKALAHPVVAFLKKNLGNHRVSGLPFPLTTGQLCQFRSLGYNGGSGLKSMATLRGTLDNPMGGGGHSWFETREDGELNDSWGVKYAYSYRKLDPLRWKETSVKNLYERTEAIPIAPSLDSLDYDYL